jgi:hypothetical protein
MNGPSQYLTAHRDAIALARATDLDEPGFVAAIESLELAEARRILVALAGLVSTAATSPDLFQRVIRAGGVPW